MTASAVERAADKANEPDLLAQARAGDGEAFADLFRMHHESALSFARSLTNPARAQDLVSEAFARIYRLVRKGAGPQTNFRAYLFTTIRAVNVDSLRKSGREVAVDDVGSVREMAVPDNAEAMAENDAVFRALRSLPERWQKVLWETAVEGRTPQQIAARLGITPNSVAALSFRAREGLRQAYLTQHIDQIPSGSECEKHADDLAKYVRGALTHKQRADLEEHVRGCRECSTIVAGLMCMDNSLGAVLLPAFLLALPVSGKMAGGLVAGTSLTAGVGALKGKLLDLGQAARGALSSAHPAVAASLAALTVAASAVAVVAHVRGADSSAAGASAYTEAGTVRSQATPESSRPRPDSATNAATARPVRAPERLRVSSDGDAGPASADPSQTTTGPGPRTTSSEPGSSSEPIATTVEAEPAAPGPTVAVEPTPVAEPPTESAAPPAPTTTVPTPTPTESVPCLLHVETVGCLVTTPDLTIPVPPTP